jgi:hypothetical protein
MSVSIDEKGCKGVYHTAPCGMAIDNWLNAWPLTVRTGHFFTSRTRQPMRMSSRTSMILTIAAALAALALAVAHAERQPAASYPDGWHVRETCSQHVTSGSQADASKRCGNHRLYLGERLVARAGRRASNTAEPPTPAAMTWPPAEKGPDGWTCPDQRRVTTRVQDTGSTYQGRAVLRTLDPVCVPDGSFRP